MTRLKSKARQVAAADSSPTMDRHIVLVRVGDLRPNPRNARTHSRKQVRQIADSITRFGFTNPALIDDGNMILAGHGRVAAAKSKGLDAVPCIRLSSLSEAEKRAYVLADNKLALNAGWDEEILADELKLILDEGELDLDLTGFSVAEVDLLFETGESGPPPEDERDNRIPRLATSAVSREGDLWLCGEHRLICGDARDDQVYRSLMTSDDGAIERAQMAFTDPPYNVKIRNNVTRTGHREFVMASGEMTPSAFRRFLEDALSRMADWSCDGSIHFICMDWRHADDLSAAGRACFGEQKNLIVWVKDNAGMGSFYRSRHELIYVFKNGSAPHINTFELGKAVATAAMSGTTAALPRRPGRRARNWRCIRPSSRSRWSSMP